MTEETQTPEPQTTEQPVTTTERVAGMSEYHAAPYDVQQEAGDTPAQESVFDDGPFYEDGIDAESPTVTNASFGMISADAGNTIIAGSDGKLLQAEAVFTELKLQNAELKEEIARLKSAPPTVVSADDMTVRVETNSAGNVIRVAYWRDSKMVKSIWEPARSWSHN